QTVALFDAKHFCPCLGGYLAIRRQRRNVRTTAVCSVVPTMISAHEMITAQPTERKRRPAVEAQVIEGRQITIGSPDDQRLIEQLDRHGLVGDFFGPSNR